MSKFTCALTVSGLVSCAAAAFGAGPPLLDRPSPPPYCADGVCQPNSPNFGWYQTRWRRWPTVPLEPTPAEIPPGGLVPEAPAFERPPKAEEDRAAPPRTQAAERALEEEQEEGTTTPQTGEQPRVLPFGQPPGGLQTPLPRGDGRPETPRLEMPWDLEQEPTTPETDTAPIPTGDLDPPPAPPFATPALVNGPTGHDGERPAQRQQPRRTAPVAPAPTHDPPPAFPIAALGR
jgi:hypothetical protein